MRIERSYMTDSWRNILERAAENLSVELSSRPVSIPSPPPMSLRRFERRAARPLTFAETRDLLARELETVTAVEKEAPTARILQNVRRKKAPRAFYADPMQIQAAPLPPSPAAKKTGGGQGLMALALSVSAFALTLYGIYLFLH